jgi:hypothetical protein
MNNNKKAIIISVSLFVVAAVLGVVAYFQLGPGRLNTALTEYEQSVATFDVSRFQCSDNRMWEDVRREGSSNANSDNLEMKALGDKEIGKAVDIEFKSEAGDWKKGVQITARICRSKTEPPVDKTITIPNYSSRRDIMTHIFKDVVPLGECMTGALFSTNPDDHEHSAPVWDYYKLCGFKVVSSPTPGPTTPPPSSSPTVRPSATPRPTGTPTSSPTPTSVPTATPTGSPSVTATPNGTPNGTATPTPVPTATPTAPPNPTSTPVAQSTPPPEVADNSSESLPNAGFNDMNAILLGGLVFSLAGIVGHLLKKKYD